MTHPPATLEVSIELFGMARIRGGIGMVTVALPRIVGLREVVDSLAAACPTLLGNVIREDLSGLEEGYVFNRSGLEFLGGETVSLMPGDSLLVLSSQAGG